VHQLVNKILWQKIIVNHRSLDHPPVTPANVSKRFPLGKSVFVWLQKKILLFSAPKFHFRVHMNPFFRLIVSQINSIDLHVMLQKIYIIWKEFNAVKRSVTEGWSPGVVVTFNSERWVASCKRKWTHKNRENFSENVTCVANTAVKINITASWKSDAMYIGLQEPTLPIILLPYLYRKRRTTFIITLIFRYVNVTI
jgi:hypothetical protein